MRAKPKWRVLGITGGFGSGKSTAADFFKRRGWQTITLSSYLEKEARSRKVAKITRKILQDIGNEWRERYGNDRLAQKAIEEMERKGAQDVVIDGLRNVGEIDRLRKAGHFWLVAIVSDRKVRFKRLHKIKRRETMPWEKFDTLDRRDLGISEKSSGLQVALCIGLADVYVENNGSLEVLEKKLGKILGRIHTSP